MQRSSRKLMPFAIFATLKAPRYMEVGIRRVLHANVVESYDELGATHLVTNRRSDHSLNRAEME